MVFWPSRGGAPGGRMSPAGVAWAGSMPARSCLRIGLRHQPRERRRDGGGIAQEGGAVRIGALHRLDQEMRPQHAVGTELAAAVAFQDVEHLDQHHAARGGWRHRDDVVAAIAPAHRRAQQRLVVLEIIARHDAAFGPHRRDQLVGDGAFVEGARAVAGDRRQGVGQIALHQGVAGRRARGRRASGKSSPPTASAPGARAEPGSDSATSSAIGRPSRASAIAGAISSARLSLPEP